MLCTLLVVLPGSFGVFCPSLETAQKMHMTPRELPEEYSSCWKQVHAR